jgi:hypothetical protein
MGAWLVCMVFWSVQLTDGDRLAQLLDDAVEHGLTQLTAKNFPTGIAKKDGKEMLKTRVSIVATACFPLYLLGNPFCICLVVAHG